MDSQTPAQGELIESATRAAAAHLRAERARADLKQSELAKLSGLSEITILRLENGQRQMSLPQLVAICAALGIAPGDFLNAAQENMREHPIRPDAE